jgi:hypothetical protein
MRNSELVTKITYNVGSWLLARPILSQKLANSSFDEFPAVD